jgi:hypothetical protein
MLNTADRPQTVPRTVLPDYHLVKGQQAPHLRGRCRCAAAHPIMAHSAAATPDPGLQIYWYDQVS